jgi:hypothetical protein
MVGAPMTSGFDPTTDDLMARSERACAQARDEVAQLRYNVETAVALVVRLMERAEIEWQAPHRWRRER